MTRMPEHRFGEPGSASGICHELNVLSPNRGAPLGPTRRRAAGARHQVFARSFGDRCEASSVWLVRL